MEKEAAQEYLRTVRELGLTREEAVSELASDEGRNALRTLRAELPSSPLEQSWQPQVVDIFVPSKEEAFTEAAKNSWDTIVDKSDPFAEDLSTPERRLRAVLNLMTGSKGLTVVSLETFALESPDAFHSYQSIHRKTNKLAKTDFLKGTNSTYGLLQRTVAPVGAAARSADSDTQWRITRFGRACVPAILYVWQTSQDIAKEFREEDKNNDLNPLDPIDIFGSVTLIAPGELDKPTPAEARTIVLSEIGSSSSTEQLTKLQAKLVGFKTRPIDIIKTFGSNGLIESRFEREGKDDTASYKLPDLSTDPDAIDINGLHPINRSAYSFARRYMPQYINALKDLHQQNPNRSFFPLHEIRTTANATELSRVNTYVMFLYLAEKGIVQKGRVIELTPKGRAVLDRILKPLQDFVKDPYSVDAINAVRNAGVYEHLPTMEAAAASHAERSPRLNPKTEENMRTILDLVRANPHGISRNELRRLTKFRTTTVAIYIKRLRQSGAIREEMTEGGEFKGRSEHICFPVVAEEERSEN